VYGIYSIYRYKLVEIVSPDVLYPSYYLPHFLVVVPKIYLSKYKPEFAILGTDKRQITTKSLLCMSGLGQKQII